MNGTIYGMAFVIWMTLGNLALMVIQRRARKSGKWRRGDTGGGMLLLYDQLFDPAKRQAFEELEGKRMTREDGVNGVLVDLDAGIVRLSGKQIHPAVDGAPSA
jgi:hypothetical protein